MDADKWRGVTMGLCIVNLHSTLKYTELLYCIASVLFYRLHCQIKLFMNTSELIALLALASAASFTPGPNTTLSTALAANYGLKRAMTFVCAVPVGWGLLFSLCAGGVGALVVAVPALRLAIKVLGVSYLLWLACKIGMARSLGEADNARLNVTFWQGVMLQFLNIKAWMLALTVVAGWMASQADAVNRFALLLPVMLFFGFTSNLLYAVMGSLLRDWLQQGHRLVWFNRFMAAVLAVTAAWMATF
jgi:threonine/homoserine/homoserine lactone efflux protein